MAIYNGINYAKQYVSKPSEKIDSGEVAGRKRLLLEKFDLTFAVLNGDTILGPKLPAGSIVTDAKIKIDKSLGATGIFQLGHLANGVDAADADAFIAAADAGGQAVLARLALEVGALKRFTKETQLVITCTEDMDGAVLDGVLTVELEYVND